MNDHLNNLKEIMDETILKDGELSSSKKREIYENTIDKKGMKNPKLFSPILSVALASFFIILIGGFLITQSFQSQPQNLANSTDTENNSAVTEVNKEHKDDIDLFYEETVYYIPFQKYNDPVVDGNNLFVHVNSPLDILNINKFIQYNLQTGEYEVLYESEYSNANMQATNVNENWITWLDFGRIGKAKILVIDRSTNEIKTIAEINNEDEVLSPPTLEDDYVAWIYTNNATEQVEVKLYNLATEETEVIANVPFQPELYYSAFMIDGKIVWNSHENGKGYYYLYDIEGKTIEKYEEPIPYPLMVKYSNDKIYALNSTGKIQLEGAVVEYWDNQTFGYLDIQTEEFQSFPYDVQLKDFDVYHNKVLILDSRSELYLYEFIDNEFKTSSITLTSGEEPSSIAFDTNGNIIVSYIGTEEDLNQNKIKFGIVRAK